jgi:ABC-type transporter Mla subunit MlaD
VDLLDLFVKISVDDDDFAQGLKNTEDVIKDTRDEIDSINTTLRKVAGSGADTTELIGLKMELLGDAISATSLKLEDLQSVSDEIKQEFEAGRIDTTVYAQYQEDIANTTASLQDLEKQLERTQNGEQGVAEQTDDLSQKALSIADIVKGSLISTAITSLIKALDTVKDKITGIVTTAASLGDTIDKQSQQLGMTTDAYQEWSYILSQNGANISTLTVSMRTLTSQIDGLKNGSAKATQAFGQLGISIDDLAGKTGEEQFSLVVQRLQSIEDTTERNVIANDLLGRSYMQLIPLLNQSSDSIEELRQKAHDTNQIMGEEGVDAAVDYTDSVDTLSKSFQGFTNRIGTAILPGITDVVKGLTDLLNATNDIDADLAVERIEEGIDRTLESVDTVMPKVSKLIDRVIEAASEKTPDILVALVDGLLNALPSVSVSIIKIAERFIITIIEALPELLPELAEAIVNTLGAVLSETNIVPLVAGVCAGVKALGISADVANLIKLIAGTEGITGAMGAVSTFASATFLPALKNAFSGAFSVLTMEAGEALTAIEAKSVETATVFHTSMATAIETLRVKIKAFGTEAIAVLNGTASAAKIAAV